MWVKRIGKPQLLALLWVISHYQLPSHMWLWENLRKCIITVLYSIMTKSGYSQESKGVLTSSILSNLSNVRHHTYCRKLNVKSKWCIWHLYQKCVYFSFSWLKLQVSRTDDVCEDYLFPGVFLRLIAVSLWLSLFLKSCSIFNCCHKSRNMNVPSFAVKSFYCAASWNRRNSSDVKGSTRQESQHLHVCVCLMRGLEVSVLLVNRL